MDYSGWSINNVDLRKISQARNEAQNAAQWLACMTLSFASSARETKDFRLRWDKAAHTIVTPEIAPGVALQLRLPELSLQFVENGRPSLHPLDLEGKSSSEVEAWLLVEMLHRGFAREDFSKKLPYRWDLQMSGDEVKYSPEALSSELTQLTNWLEDSAGVLRHVQEEYFPRLPESRKFIEGHPKDEESCVVCWPDRFCIGFSVNEKGEEGVGASTITVGFTVGDEYASDPGFFVKREGIGDLKPSVVALPLKQIARDRMSLDTVAAHLNRELAGLKKSKTNSATA